MACACKVNKQIDYLHKKYGHNVPTAKSTIIGFRIKEFFKNLWVYLLCIPVLPIMILHIIFVSVFKKDKTISVKKLLRLKTVN